MNDRTFTQYHMTWKQILRQHAGSCPENFSYPINQDIKPKQNFFLAEERSLTGIFLNATWLPHGQLWATVERAASLTRC